MKTLTLSRTAWLMANLLEPGDFLYLQQIDERFVDETDGTLTFVMVDGSIVDVSEKE